MSKLECPVCGEPATADCSAPEGVACGHEGGHCAEHGACAHEPTQTEPNVDGTCPCGDWDWPELKEAMAK